MIRSKSTGETFDRLFTLLKKEKKVYYSRYGDGDIFIMMGRSQANHDFSPELQKEMIDSFAIEDPLYLKGLAVNYPHERKMKKGFMGRYHRNNLMEKFLEEKFDYKRPTYFESAWLTHYYSVFKPKEMVEFLDTFIRPPKKMFIGNINKKDIEKFIGKVDYYIEVPAKNAYFSIDKWWPEIMNAIKNVELVLPAAGMSTRVINKRLWEEGVKVHSIDLGSIVDAVGNKNTRRWIRLKGHVIYKILLPPYNSISFRQKISYILKEINFFFANILFAIKY